MFSCRQLKIIIGTTPEKWISEILIFALETQVSMIKHNFTDAFLQPHGANIIMGIAPTGLGFLARERDFRTTSIIRNTSVMFH